MQAPRVKRTQRLYPSPDPGGGWGFAALDLRSGNFSFWIKLVLEKKRNLQHAEGGEIPLNTRPVFCIPVVIYLNASITLVPLADIIVQSVSQRPLFS
jgi:hypothetical protein